MENPKQTGKYFLYAGAGLSLVSLIGLISIQSARRAGAFGDIVSVSDCQISFLKGGAGCEDSLSPYDSQEALWQAGLVLGIIALGVAFWLRWAANNRPTSLPTKGSKEKNSSIANSSGNIKGKLMALEELREEKLISEAEFKSRRDKLLGEL
jgi:hypothetical protein